MCDNVKEYNSIIIDKSFRNLGGQPRKFTQGYNECKEEVEDYFKYYVVEDDLIKEYDKLNDTHYYRSMFMAWLLQ